MTRSRSTSHPGPTSLLQSAGCPRKGSRPLLLLLLLGLLSSSPVAGAQPPAGTVVPSATTDSVVATTTAAQPASSWTTVWAVLGGVVIGALGVWLWARRSATPEDVARPLTDAVPETPASPTRKTPAQNVRKSTAGPDSASTTAAPTASPTVAPDAAAAANAPGKSATAQSLREVQGVPKPPSKSSGSNKKNKPNYNSRSSTANPAEPWPQVPRRSPSMNPSSPTVPPAGDNQPLEPGQTVEWTAPTSTPPAIQELIDASAPPAISAAEAAAPVPSTGPVHYYAPAPDVPSIEHRKLSPNPLPQMPLLITLPHAEATTAQFSFSPQADQSRIIGNGVRELKEFFAFELPPTEQFTAIKNLKPGKLEKRDEAWHVVQKAEIALS